MSGLQDPVMQGNIYMFNRKFKYMLKRVHSQPEEKLNKSISIHKIKSSPKQKKAPGIWSEGEPCRWTKCLWNEVNS